MCSRGEHTVLMCHIYFQIMNAKKLFGWYIMNIIIFICSVILQSLALWWIVMQHIIFSPLNTAFMANKMEIYNWFSSRNARIFLGYTSYKWIQVTKLITRLFWTLSMAVASEVNTDGVEIRIFRYTPTPWPMMPCLLVSPGNQQPWGWLTETGTSLPWGRI